jgi:hypothetical protein
MNVSVGLFDSHYFFSWVVDSLAVENHFQKTHLGSDYHLLVVRFLLLTVSVKSGAADVVSDSHRPV